MVLVESLIPPVILISPSTCNLSVGDVVPIPIFATVPTSKATRESVLPAATYAYPPDTATSYAPLIAASVNDPETVGAAGFDISTDAISPPDPDTNA